MKRRNEARKICRDKKRELINNEIKELETESRKNENRKFYKKLEKLPKLINQEIEMLRLAMDQY